MDRLERLLDLIAALIDAERPMSRDQIHERVPGYPDSDASFRRQFERDKETLRRLGVPISIEPVFPAYPEKGSGYRIHRQDYALADPGLTPGELTALHLASSSVSFLGPEAAGAIRKLGGVPPERSTEGAGTSVRVPGAEHLEPAFTAITEGRELRFGYRGTPRRVVPRRLSFRSGQWYLAAWDLDRAEERDFFRLDRITADPEPGDIADPELTKASTRDRRSLDPWELGDEETMKARLWVDTEQAEQVARRLGDRATVQPAADGSAVVEFPVNSTEGFRVFALGLLDHAEVLGPPALRDDMISWLRAIRDS